MTKRWERELQRLNDLEVPTNQIRERSRQGSSGNAPDPQSSPTRRIVTAVVALGLFLGAALFVREAFRPVGGQGIPGGPSATAGSELPGVLRITCNESGAELESETVRVQADGVHILVSNPGHRDFVYLRDPLDLGQSLGFDPDDGREHVFPWLRVQDWLVGCFDNPFSTYEHPVSDYARVSLLDPDGVWVSTEMACDRTPADDFHGDDVMLFGVPDERIASELLDRTPGLRPTDVVEPAGYPKSTLQWYRAVRDGQTIARFMVSGGPAEVRHAIFETCKGSGIGT